MIIGIDFGTTTSIAAYHDGVTTTVFETADGDRTMPSVVSVLEAGKILVGSPAVHELTENPEFTFQNIKRQLGEPWNEMEDTPFQLAGGPDGMTWFIGPDRLYSPEELTAAILRELKALAEEQTGQKVTGAVITIPSKCSEAQREATLRAGEAAGLGSVTTLLEPHAAAMGYGFHENKMRRIAAYDFGGGTFDIALMKAGYNGFDEVGSLGISNRGGVDFDQRISRYATDAFLMKHEGAVEVLPAAMVVAESAAERAKRRLSTRDRAYVRATMFGRHKETRAAHHLNQEISVQEFDDLVADYIKETIGVCGRLLEQVGWAKTRIDDVILVGGMTRVPAVRRAVEAFFEKTPIMRNPEIIIAMGAAIKAAQKDGRIAMAHSASLPVSVGIEALDGRYMILLPRGTEFGAERSVKLTNHDPDQSMICVRVLRGEGETPQENELLQAWDEPIEPGPAGSATVPITLKILDDGTIEVNGT